MRREAVTTATSVCAKMDTGVMVLIMGLRLAKKKHVTLLMPPALLSHAQNISLATISQTASAQYVYAM